MQYKLISKSRAMPVNLLFGPPLTDTPIVRQFGNNTFSSSPYFDDRGLHGAARPITERVNVIEHLDIPVKSLLISVSASFKANSILLFPKGSWCSTLWGGFLSGYVSRRSVVIKHLSNRKTTL